MRIAFVAPPFGMTGGPEVACLELADALSRKGVDVTLFAPADWHTDLPLFPTLKQSLWNMPDFAEQDENVRRRYIVASQVAVLPHQDEYELIHLHSQAYAYAVAASLHTPSVVTFHNKVTEADLRQLAETKACTVALSEAQRGALPVDSVIHLGAPLTKIRPRFDSGEYLLCVGRITEQKGIHVAIDIAKRAGKKLIIIGRIGLSEERQRYFTEQIAPHIDGKNVMHIENVPHTEIFEYMRKAAFLLFPILRPETFGLVAAEALACGTPVLGSQADPLPELIGKAPQIALLSDDPGVLADAANHPERFDRKECRRYAEAHFSWDTCADEYIALYKKLLSL